MAYCLPNIPVDYWSGRPPRAFSEPSASITAPGSSRHCHSPVDEYDAFEYAGLAVNYACSVIYAVP
jgi:hypothetical protein